MVQILSIIVFKHQEGKAPLVLAQSFALDAFSFFQRGSIKEPLTSSVAAVCDEEYPRYVAFSALKEALEIYTRVKGELWKNMTADANETINALDQTLTKFQNPAEADKVQKIQKELEETKNIVIKNLDQLLERGEKLDDLVAKSNDLSFQSKAFASRAEDMNRCCTIL